MSWLNPNEHLGPIRSILAISEIAIWNVENSQTKSSKTSI